MTATASTSGHGDAGVGQRLVEDRHDPAEVGPCGDLRDDPAGRRVERGLAGDDVGVDSAAALDDRDPRLVAGRFDGEDQRPAHRRLRFVGPASAAGGGVELRSEPRSSRSRKRGSRERLGRHDQRVLAVVAVVARPQADGPEAVLLVEPPGGDVRQADLEGRLAGVAPDREVEERDEQPLADPLAAPGRDEPRTS